MALLLTFYLIFALGFVLPSVRVWKTTGINPYVLSRGDSAEGFVATGFRIVMITMGVYLALRAAFPQIDNSLGMMPLLSDRSVGFIGWSGLGVAVIWMILAQYQMGASWRIGIDRQQSTALVSNGLFAWSRNPIFLGMRVSLAALFLVNPNALTLTVAVAGDILMQVQVRLEENHLSATHGSAYDQYRQAVRRWI